MADVITLPVIRIERGDVELDRQKLLPASDRRNVIELWRERAEREIEGFAREERR